VFVRLALRVASVTVKPDTALVVTAGADETTRFITAWAREPKTVVVT
jgi:hypothetical protein